MDDLISLIKEAKELKGDAEFQEFQDKLQARYEAVEAFVKHAENGIRQLPFEDVATFSMSALERFESCSRSPRNMPNKIGLAYLALAAHHISMDRVSAFFHQQNDET